MNGMCGTSRACLYFVVCLSLKPRLPCVVGGGGGSLRCTAVIGRGQHGPPKSYQGKTASDSGTFTLVTHDVTPQWGHCLQL